MTYGDIGKHKIPVSNSAEDKIFIVQVYFEVFELYDKYILH